VARDWHEWHRSYDTPDSPLALRLATVQRRITDVFDGAPPGPVRVISMCAGQGRDLLGVLETHARRNDVTGRLVELDPELAGVARAGAPAGVEVLCADAGACASYEGAVPADLVLVCGVFGNIADADIARTIEMLPTLCAPDAIVIWTRNRKPPDATPKTRARFSATGFEDVAFDAPGEVLYAVGTQRLVVAPRPFDPAPRLFEFTDHSVPVDCAQCGFSYDIGRMGVNAWLKSDAEAFVQRCAAIGPVAQRARPAPDVWSPLEYACHVRDVLRVQHERIELAQRADEPVFTPMRRDERVIEDRYNEQDPVAVSAEILAAADALVATLASLDEAGWARTGIYNYPEPASRTVEWIAVHTVHELLHHRIDIGILA
jgi:hypothetical protein